MNGAAGRMDQLGAIGTNFGGLVEKLQSWINGFISLIPNLIAASVLFLVAWLVSVLVTWSIRKTLVRHDRPALANVGGSLVGWAIIVLGFLLAMTVVLPSLKPGDMLAGLGIGSVAIGFAFKDILQNMLSGILILLQRPFKVGDQIEAGGHEGTVEDIQTRATMIRTYDNRRVVIPNSQVYTNSVVVNTAYDKRRSDYDVGIGYADDWDRARAVILEAVSVVEGVADEPAAEAVPAPPWLAPRRTWSDVVADTIDAWTNSTQAWIDSLSVSEERKVELTESFWNLRRTFFNQAPTVAPVQISGLITGPIDGTIGAVDADGDEIVYRLVRGPRQGTVEINADGTYTYTPDVDFDGVDTFRVIAIDRGFHVNLLSLLRPIGTRATSLINQGAITFAFNYTDGGTSWTEDRRQALEDVATQLLLYFRVNAPVTLTYDVGLQDNDALASAGSNVILDRSGFWRTVVQNKLLTGYDSNGSEADGQIDWNFRDYEWALGDSVESSEYDFVSTAIHELMHSFGFLSYVDEAGKSDERIWTTFDSFVVTSAGARPISPFYRWRNRFDPLLTDEEDGLYFGGAHAIAAFGGLVPLYTPNPWEPGSSMSHLDDLTFTGLDQKIMNAATDTGLGVRVFSAVELAILTDLGYQVVMPDSPPYAAAALWFVLLGGRRRKSKAAPR